MREDGVKLKSLCLGMIQRCKREAACMAVWWM